jgi:3D (Asp-Asp-Asp) domain-containing protein
MMGLTKFRHQGIGSLLLLLILIGELVFFAVSTISPLQNKLVQSLYPKRESLAAINSQTINMYVTFYGWPDNDPPGRAIAYPKIHNQAGGTGTYQDPVTFATDPTEFPPGTKVYIPFLKKYGIMEDYCAQCVDDWDNNKYHIDIWLNSNSSFDDQVISCEHYWTKSSIAIQINPPADIPVYSKDIFNTSTGSCLKSILIPPPSPFATPLATPIPTKRPSPTPVPSTLPPSKVGDLNGDNQVNIFDLSILLSNFES